MEKGGAGSTGFAKSQQKVLMAKQKVQHRDRQTGAAGRRSEVVPRNPAGCQETVQPLRTGGKPSQGFKTKDFRPFRAQSMGHRQDGVKTFSLILGIQGYAPFQRLGGHAPGAESEHMDAKTKTVLIVEDNELNMKLFHDLLDAHGYNILQTKDGMEALDIAREHHPDLILMDIQLPEVSGLEVTKWLKEDDSPLLNPFRWSPSPLSR